MNGILNLLKPAGMTSHDCIAIIRRIAGQRKVGHTGTLDPNACGVLPMCLGSATRLIEFMEQHEKCYRCEALLGIQTNTQDIWGTVLESRRGEAKTIGEDAVREALLRFQGKISQKPPAYSAVKVNGKRLYRYARAGIDVDITSRDVTVHSIRLLRYDSSSGRILFDISCSKGTYVRTICNDLGQLLGVGACMSFLLRTRTSGMDLANARTLEELSALDPKSFEMSLLPLETGVRGYKKLLLNTKQAGFFENGNPNFADGLKAPELMALVASEKYAVFFRERFLGMAEYSSESGYKIRKVL